MMPLPDDFQIAARRARERVGEPIWTTMSSHEQTIAIYEELRALDLERVAREAAREPPTSGGTGPSR